MHRFIVLYCAPLAVAERFAQATPDEAQRGMQAWVDWGQRVGDAMVDPGNPLGNARNVTSRGITGSDSDIIGMTILQAESMEGALELVKDHHHLHWAEGTEIVVLEELSIPELQLSTAAAI